MSDAVTTTPNPLLNRSQPVAFDAIHPEHVEPAMDIVLAELEDELTKLERQASPRWDDVIRPLEEISMRINTTWGVVGTLLSVRNSEELRAAHEAMQPRVVQFMLRMGQSRPVYDALTAMREVPEWDRFDGPRKRVVDSLLREAKHAGVGLEGDDRSRFNEIQEELAELGTRFYNNVIDATKAFSLILRDRDEVAGLPDSLLEQTAQSARQAGHPEATAQEGPWLITLDMPCVQPVIEFSERRDLREKVYRALVTRASAGEQDNTRILTRILKLRDEKARLLGYGSYADMSLAAKMADDVDAVESLMEELRQAAHAPAEADLEEVRTYAREHGETEPLKHWDFRLWSQRLRKERFGYNEEELRPYFPMPRVLEGLFDLTHRLFGVTVRQARGDMPGWHPDVRTFEVVNGGGEVIASLYFDPYSRPQEKRGGAWVEGLIPRRRTGSGADELTLPVAVMVCNQAPPIGDEPALMTFNEVSTLFHEFGHALHNMLTTVDHGLVSGTQNVEWDAVELPSMFMENWCYHRPTLRSLSRHVKTGKPLPDEIIDQIIAARSFRAGSHLLRQLHFTLTDLSLHHRYDPTGSESPFDIERTVARKTALIPPLPEDRMLCAFGHIFSGGYAAGYYSYLWAEVLSADAFSVFEEAGLDDPDAMAECGRRFRDVVLAVGGSRAPMDVFKDFRGREPTIDALLRQLELAAG